MMLCRDPEEGYARYICRGCRFEPQTTVLHVAAFPFREAFQSISTQKGILTSVDNLSGSVERISYYNPENGYTVLRLLPEGSNQQRVPGLSFDGLATVIGNLPELSPGEHLRLHGNWDTHPKHGKQFKVEVCEQTLPAEG